MTTHPLAGKPAPREILVDIDKLRKAYYGRKPDVADGAQRVSFGTSGHRGSSLRGAFNEAHVLAIAQAICDYRGRQGINGPLYIGRDTHALSEPASTAKQHARKLQGFTCPDSLQLHLQCVGRGGEQLA